MTLQSECMWTMPFNCMTFSLVALLEPCLASLLFASVFFSFLLPVFFVLFVSRKTSARFVSPNDLNLNYKRFGEFLVKGVWEWLFGCAGYIAYSKHPYLLYSVHSSARISCRFPSKTMKHLLWNKPSIVWFLHVHWLAVQNHQHQNRNFQAPSGVGFGKAPC